MEEILFHGDWKVSSLQCLLVNCPGLPTDITNHGLGFRVWGLGSRV